MLSSSAGVAAGDAAPGQTIDCAPSVSATSINGRPASDVAPPAGFVSEAGLSIVVQAGFEGADCAAALNQAPVLLGAWVTSDLTTHNRDFRYRVTYVDLDNDPPAQIEAVLDGIQARPMLPLDPSDSNYVDGVVFSARFAPEFVNDILVPGAEVGDHWAILRASDGLAQADEVRVDGPRIVRPIEGTLLAPNPSNRLFIHPIANGPTLVPPTEVLPPLARLVADAPNGVYSSTFEIDPMAAVIGSEWSVGTGADFRLRNYGLLEGEATPENGFELLGPARTDPRAHVGAQAVDLSPDGAVADAIGGLGVLRAFPDNQLNLAHVGAVRAYYRTPDGPAPAGLRVTIEADSDGDAVVDLCAVHERPPASAPDWTAVRVDRSTPMRLLFQGCAAPVPGAPEEAPLGELQNHPSAGLSKVVSVRFDAVSSPGSPSGGSLLIDSLQLNRGSLGTNADIDICFYGGADALPASPLQPLECVSDIGTHSGVLPPGTRVVNVWADQMTPATPLGSALPGRTYLEPALYGFGIFHRRAEGPSIELPAAPTGRLRIVDDQDGDGVQDPAESILASVDGLPVDAMGPERTLQVPFERPDGAHALLLVYDAGVDGLGPATRPLLVQRFVNDAPVPTLLATTHPHPKHTVTFSLSASDADEGQGVAALGGVRTWRLEFGDGSPAAEGVAPLPASWEHTYHRHRDYAPVLTVTDAQGASASASVLLSIGGHPRWSDDVE